MNKIKKIVEGGSTRQDSVIRGLLAAKGNDVVLIHDGARPFVDNRIIEDGIKYANIYDACACGVEPKDTIKIKTEDGFSLNTPKRDFVFCANPPMF